MPAGGCTIVMAACPVVAFRPTQGETPLKSGGFLDGTSGAGKTGAELLDAASFDDAGLGARVEEVRLRSDLAFEQRVGLAIDFDGFTAVQGRARNESVAGLLVQKNNFAVFGVDAFFHGNFLWLAPLLVVGRQSG